VEEAKVSRVSVVAGEVGGEQTEMLAGGQACTCSDASIKVVATRTSLDGVKESLAVEGVEGVLGIQTHQHCGVCDILLITASMKRQER